VTKEETPPSVGQFIKQRTRWNQGFLQILKRGDYWRLPRFEQRLLALYTLSSPIFQALTALYLPLSLYTMFFVKMPPLIAMILWLPAYMLIGQYVMNLVGLYEFASEHSIKLPKMIWLKLLGSFYPFQVLLGISALRAVWREIQGMNTWEKTKHVNAHRGTTAG
jgi:glycosyltransferase XagB